MKGLKFTNKANWVKICKNGDDDERLYFDVCICTFYRGSKNMSNRYSFYEMSFS